MSLLKRIGASHPPATEWTKVPSLGIHVHARIWPASRPGAQGAPIVLVHGVGLSSRSMVPLGRRLAALGYEVLSPDLPGFGQTPKPAGAPWPAGPDVREQMDHLLAWLDARAIQRAVLFGNSVGVQVAVALAVHAPERVERLILAGPTPDPRYRVLWKQAPLVIFDQLFEAPSFGVVVQLEYGSAGLMRVAQQGWRTIRDPIETKLPRVTVPALVLRGQFDPTLRQCWAEEFTRMIPNAKLAVIEGTGHNVQFSAPHVTARAVDGFVSGSLDGVSLVGGEIHMPHPNEPDPARPAAPLSTRAKSLINYAAGAFCLVGPRVLGWCTLTRKLLGAAGAPAIGTALAINRQCDVRRKLPVPLFLNLEVASGLGLLASAMFLRRETAAGRWTVAAVGAFELLTPFLTRKPVGPARLVHPPAGNDPA